MSESLSKYVSQLKTSLDKSPSHEDTLRAFRELQVYLLRNHNNVKSNAELKLAMDGLEMGATASISSKNFDLFERVFQQLKQFYASKELKKQSTNRQYLQGLYLMYLLVKNKPETFHTEIEQLEFEDLENKFIKLPINVDEYLMDGRYNKVLSLMNKLPDQNFAMFLAEMENTIRNEIAASLQLIHDSMPVKNAIQILHLSDNKGLQTYITETNRKWSIEGNKLLFQVTSEKKTQT